MRSLYAAAACGCLSGACLVTEAILTDRHMEYLIVLAQLSAKVTAEGWEQQHV